MQIRRRAARRALAGGLAAAAVLVLTVAADGQSPPTDPGAPASGLVAADRYTGTGPGPLVPGQIELAVTSTLSPLVTGGDARLALRGLAPDDTYSVTLDDGTDVTAAFTRRGSVADGVVGGFRDGENQVTATVQGGTHGTRTAVLTVDNHPISGPIISGPHQEPFTCETEEVGMGPPLDEDCFAPTKVQWFWRDQLPGTFHPLADPYAPYPPEVATVTTLDGRQVPFVVRVESSVINRSITRIAVLDDPAARGPDVPYTPSEGWNRSAIYQFGESCGTGYHQGRNHVSDVLGESGVSAENIAGILVSPAQRLADGYAFVHSTLTIFGVHCNQVLSAETAIMVKEHLIEAYGPVEQVIGVGASGGALQQYTIIDGYPGVLDAGIPILSFPDVVTTAMTTADCGLLQRVFDRDPDRWNELKQIAVTGLTTSQQCRDWIDLFLENLDPVGGCSGAVPDELRYDRDTNPDGARCTIQDNLVNLVGRDPATGFARRPVDNTGVQYGWRALQTGQISMEEFVLLNEQAGGFDIDGQWQPQRMSMPADLAELLYRYGAVTGRGAPEETPIIDLRLYVDVVPVLGFHDQVRPYIFDARLTERGLGASHVIWNGVPLASEAVPVAHAWAEAIDRAYRPGADRAAVVAASAPPGGHDTCVVPTSVTDLLPIQLPNLPLIEVPGCDVVFGLTQRATTRRAAGGPATDDVIKCQLRPIRRGDYPPMTDGQWTRLQAVFADGVCDWSVPGVGETERSVTWASVGDDELQPPHQVVNEVARSAGPAAPPRSTEGIPTSTAISTGVAGAGGAGAAGDGVGTLPTTGGQQGPAFLLAAVLLALALVLRVRPHGGEPPAPSTDPAPWR